MKKMDKKLTRQYFDVKDACFADHTEWKNGVLAIRGGSSLKSCKIC